MLEYAKLDHRGNAGVEHGDSASWFCGIKGHYMSKLKLLISIIIKNIVITSVLIVGFSLVSVEAAPLRTPCLKTATDELKNPDNAATPIRHQPYFRLERDLFGYNPAFTPNVVSFGPRNVPFIRHKDLVQRLNTANCKWKKFNFTKAIKMKFPAWDGNTFNALLSSATDHRIVFDDDGDAYMHVASKLWRGVGRSLLLHSRNKGKNWDVYELPSEYRFAHLEARDSHNDRSQPPVLILWDGSHSTLALIAPKKNVGGTLTIPKPVPFSFHAFAPSAQAGGSNVAVTKGKYSYIVWASKLSRDFDGSGGTPTYIIRYNHTDNTLSDPIYLGYGDAANEKNSINNHAIPGITIDSTGHLHVLMGSHHQRFKYTRSKEPYSISSGWSYPDKIGASREGDPDTDPQCVQHCDQYTYISLVIGPDDTLHLISRWAGYQRGVGNYYMQLAYHRKPKGAVWENRRDLVVPFRPWYANWYQKLTVDRIGRLFLYYIHYANQFNTIEAQEYNRKWPDDKILEGTKSPLYPPESGIIRDHYDNVKPHDPVLLISKDKGNSWQIAISKDF